MLGDKPILELGEDKVYPMKLTPENIQKFWDKASQFPTLFGREIRGNVMDFIEVFNPQDTHMASLFFVLNDFDGVFYITDIVPEEDALVHYTFFDRKHNGREELVKEMLKFVFKRYNFARLSAQIPNYATDQARHFVQKIGFAYEGKRRKAAKYKGDVFDVNLYGILKSEALNG